MAITLNTPTSYIMFTSACRQLEFSADCNSLLFVLKERETTIVYQTHLDVYNGIATIYDVRSLLEDYMRSNNLSFSTFDIYCKDAHDPNEISVLNHVKNLWIVYSYHAIPYNAEYFIANRFLTTLTVHRTYPHCTEILPLLTGGGAYTSNPQSVYVNAYCAYLSAGEYNTANVQLISYSNVAVQYVSLYLSYDWLIAKLQDQGIIVDKILAYTILFGDRTHTFYVHESTPELSFTFKNSFNAWETIRFSAVTVANTKVEQSSSISGGQMSFYDQRTNKTYETNTSPLSRDESRWVEDFFMSRDVRLGDISSTIDYSDKSISYSNPTDLPKILISDSSCEISDSNSELNRVKFTWRFADERPHAEHLLIGPDRIHSEQFTYQYN